MTLTIKDDLFCIQTGYLQKYWQMSYLKNKLAKSQLQNKPQDIQEFNMIKKAP